MINYDDFTDSCFDNGLKKLAEKLPELTQSGLSTQRHGDLQAWLDVLNRLPSAQPSTLNLKDMVQIGQRSDVSDSTFDEISDCFKSLIPWRKGPYSLFGLDIDTEWHSDWKWDRVLPHIAPLKDKMVLDVGCGNGYHCLRMFGEGAKQVVGIDPSPRFIVQFYMMKKFLGKLKVDLLPSTLEELPENLAAFDTCFSMGVLYHRRSPMDHIRELKATLKKGGQLILETLVIDGERGEVLVPEGRYAMMNNVWFLPSPGTLESWLKKCGFHDVRTVDITQTSTKEQRATEWMKFQSLKDFLDPKDSNLTIEGHPAPKRATIIATK